MLFFRRICSFFATLFGVGYVTFMPGTFGTIVAVVVYMLLPFEWFTEQSYLPYTGIGLLVLFLFGGVVSSAAEKLHGKDASVIVIDEFAGYFIAIMMLPRTPWTLVYSFVLFRVFDIAKPFPIYRLQRLPGGLGVMTDDILAGVYTNVILHILLKINPIFFGVTV